MLSNKKLDNKCSVKCGISCAYNCRFMYKKDLCEIQTGISRWFYIYM